MLRHKVKEWYLEEVRLNTEAPANLRETLLRPGSQPRVEAFLDRLTGQLVKARQHNFRRGVAVKDSTLKHLVYDMTKLFMKGMEGEAKRRYETDMQRAAREAEAAKVKEFDAVLAGQAEGEFAEAGVITNEKIDAQREEAPVIRKVEN